MALKEIEKYIENRKQIYERLEGLNQRMYWVQKTEVALEEILEGASNENYIKDVKSALEKVKRARIKIEKEIQKFRSKRETLNEKIEDLAVDALIELGVPEAFITEANEYMGFLEEPLDVSRLGGFGLEVVEKLVEEHNQPGGNEFIEVTPIQAVIWIKEMIGQISDGAWEGTRYGRMHRLYSRVNLVLVDDPQEARVLYRLCGK
ncbi:MAG: hypothetical protein ACTSPB_07450 [Candidatus Thorarchaeota archaeon]